MFRNAKVGDRVFSYLNGWGEIIGVDKDCLYPILFNSDDGEYSSFTIDGKKELKDINPTLFWSEIKLENNEISCFLEKELKRLEIKEFEKDKENWVLCFTAFHNDFDLCNEGNLQRPTSIYFTKESLLTFLENTKNKGITKEEFFETYEKVFGGNN